MSAAVDYRDGRDAVSGEIVTLVRIADLPERFADTRTEVARMQAQADRVLAAEERQDNHRSIVLDAAIGTLRGIIEDAEQGFYPDRAVQAASADLVIAHLGEQLRAARALIPAEAGADALIRIDTALAAAGLA